MNEEQSVNAGAIVPAAHMSRAVVMRAQMEAEKEVRAIVVQYMNEAMKEGTDYGKIPGTKMPTLLKPGSEKLMDLFRCSPDYDVARRIEDWDTGLFHYEIRCTLTDSDGVVRAVGLGSANSREGRYRWRNGGRKCPECGSEAILKSKFDDGGWYCFDKKGGCGAKFAKNDPAIVDQQLGKVENDDIYTLVNTILKMAKKRAQVDAAIALARCSDLFTQDVEDIMGHDVDSSNTSERPKQNGNGRKQEQRKPEPKKPAGPAAGPDAVLLSGPNKGTPINEASIEQLTKYQGICSDQIEKLENSRAPRERVKAAEDHLECVREALMRAKAEAAQAAEDNPDPHPDDQLEGDELHPGHPSNYG